MTDGKYNFFSFKVFTQFIQASYNLENGHCITKCPKNDFMKSRAENWPSIYREGSMSTYAYLPATLHISTLPGTSKTAGNADIFSPHELMLIILL